MFIFALASLAHAGVQTELPTFSLDAPEAAPPVAESLGLPEGFDAAAFDDEVAAEQAQLAAVLAAAEWKVVVPGERIVTLDADVRGWTGAAMPASALGDLLSGLPAFVPARGVGWRAEDEAAPGGYAISYAKVIYGQNGLPRFAARGVSADLGGECGGGFVQYTDLLVSYDEEGSPERLFLTANTWDGVAVAHHVAVAEPVYDDGAIVGFDLQTRDRSLPCEFCDADLWREMGGYNTYYEVSRVRF